MPNKHSNVVEAEEASGSSEGGALDACSDASWIINRAVDVWTCWIKSRSHRPEAGNRGSICWPLCREMSSCMANSSLPDQAVTLQACSHHMK